MSTVLLTATAIYARMWLDKHRGRKAARRSFKWAIYPALFWTGGAWTRISPMRRH
jgi:hypothetical protein